MVERNSINSQKVEGKERSAFEESFLKQILEEIF